MTTPTVTVHPIARCTSTRCDWQDRPHTWVLTLDGFRLQCDACGNWRNP